MGFQRPLGLWQVRSLSGVTLWQSLPPFFFIQLEHSLFATVVTRGPEDFPCAPRLLPFV